MARNTQAPCKELEDASADLGRIRDWTEKAISTLRQIQELEQRTAAAMEKVRALVAELERRQAAAAPAEDDAPVL